MTTSFTRRELWLAGSRRGYYGDIDDSSSSDDDGNFSSNGSSGSTNRSFDSNDTVAAGNTESSSLTFEFYKDVQPRRRQRRRRSRGHPINKAMQKHQQTVIPHPDIDLSLVSLLTSTEHDRRQMKKLQRAALRLHRMGRMTLPESLQRRYSSCLTANNATACHQGISYSNAIEDESYSSSSSSSSSEGSDTKYCNRIIRTEHEYSKALSSRSPKNRPLAVIDYGSVQFGQLGSVLDSIYKIGIDNDKKVDDSSSRTIGKEVETIGLVDNNGAVLKSTAVTTTTQPPALMTVASSRSSEVAAVIASLKNPSANSAKRKASDLKDRSGDVKKIKLLSRKIKLLSLEDAVAFSPYARVLFTAEFPHTVVYVNAAYGTLAKQGLANPCALGYPLITTNASSSSMDWIGVEEEISQTKDVSKILTNHLGISKENINHRLFPIVSDDESFCDFARSYHHQMHNDSSHHRSYEVKGMTEGEDHRVHFHVSHYLLQIEPVAQLTESRL